MVLKKAAKGFTEVFKDFGKKSAEAYNKAYNEEMAKEKKARKERIRRTHQKKEERRIRVTLAELVEITMETTAVEIVVTLAELVVVTLEDMMAEAGHHQEERIEV